MTGREGRKAPAQMGTEEVPGPQRPGADSSEEMFENLDQQTAGEKSSKSVLAAPKRDRFFSPHSPKDQGRAKAPKKETMAQIISQFKEGFPRGTLGRLGVLGRLWRESPLKKENNQLAESQIEI